MKVNAVVLALLILSVALAGCADGSEDLDDDGLPDRDERRGWEAIVYGMEESRTVTFQSDPTKEDTDGDGLTDWDEIFVRGHIGPFLNPSNPDTDGDGLTDCQEWYIQLDGKRCPVPEGFRDYDYEAYQTNPSFADSDFPSHSRYLARHANDGQGYFDHEGYQMSNDVYIWGDGINDGDEIFGYDIERPDGTVQRGVTSDPANLDTDGDDLEDGEERFLFGSDPLVADTDGDGCLDGSDIFPVSKDTYRVVPHRLQLQQVPDGGSTARLMMPLVVAGAASSDVQFLPETGHLEVARGDTVEFSLESIDFKARSDCTPDSDLKKRVASPFHPWILVQAIPLHKDEEADDDNGVAFRSGQWMAIDTASESAPDGVVPDQVYWNPQEDVYRWSIPESQLDWTLEDDPNAFTADADGWVRQEGPGGVFYFRAEVKLD